MKNQFETYCYTRVDDGPYSNDYPSIAWHFHVDYDKQLMRFTMARCSERDNFSKDFARATLKRRLRDNEDVFWQKIRNDIPLVEQAINCLQEFKDTTEVSGLVKRVLEDYEYIKTVNNLIGRLL